jgi:hypothetical protein
MDREFARIPSGKNPGKTSLTGDSNFTHIEE